MSLTDNHGGDESRFGSLSVRAILALVLVMALIGHSFYSPESIKALERAAEIAIIWYFAQKKLT